MDRNVYREVTDMFTKKGMDKPTEGEQKISQQEEQTHEGASRTNERG